jgi:hypothetical protein
MTDIHQEPTSILIKAIRQAKDARAGTDTQHYASAVARLTQALDAAERHARNTPTKRNPQCHSRRT